VVATLANGTKVKRRVPRMRACNEHNEKGKPCHGHLKRWYGQNPELEAAVGKTEEIYRCERCKTFYLPNQEEHPRTGILSW
jgi:hypothetical protein